MIRSTPLITVDIIGFGYSTLRIHRAIFFHFIVPIVAIIIFSATWFRYYMFGSEYDNFENSDKTSSEILSSHVIRLFSTSLISVGVVLYIGFAIFVTQCRIFLEGIMVNSEFVFELVVFAITILSVVYSSTKFIPHYPFSQKSPENVSFCLDFVLFTFIAAEGFYVRVVYYLRMNCLHLN